MANVLSVTPSAITQASAVVSVQVSGVSVSGFTMLGFIFGNKGTVVEPFWSLTSLVNGVGTYNVVTPQVFGGTPLSVRIKASYIEGGNELVTDPGPIFTWL